MCYSAQVWADFRRCPKDTGIGFFLSLKMHNDA